MHLLNTGSLLMHFLFLSGSHLLLKLWNITVTNDLQKEQVIKYRWLTQTDEGANETWAPRQREEKRKQEANFYIKGTNTDLPI